MKAVSGDRDCRDQRAHVSITHCGCVRLASFSQFATELRT
jgi:hypothetical protein